MSGSGRGGPDGPDQRPDDYFDEDDEPTTPDLEAVGGADDLDDDVPSGEPTARRPHGARPGSRRPPAGRSPRPGYEGAAHLRRGPARSRTGSAHLGPRDRGTAGRRRSDDHAAPPPRRPRPRSREEMVVDSVGVAADVPAGMRPPGRRYLLDSERRVIFVRRHPALLMRYVLETLGALILAGMLTARLPHDLVLLDVVWYGVLFVIARLLYHLAEWSVDRLVVTDRRMMLITGLFTRKVAMMPLLKVTDMTFERSVMGRILGYGEFIMESAGQDQALHRVNYVPAPDRLYRQVSELLFGGYAGAPAPGQAAGGFGPDGDD